MSLTFLFLYEYWPNSQNLVVQVQLYNSIKMSCTDYLAPASQGHHRDCELFRCDMSWLFYHSHVSMTRYFLHMTTISWAKIVDIFTIVTQIMSQTLNMTNIVTDTIWSQLIYVTWDLGASLACTWDESSKFISVLVTTRLYSCPVSHYVIFLHDLCNVVSWDHAVSCLETKEIWQMLSSQVVCSPWVSEVTEGWCITLLLLSALTTWCRLLSVTAKYAPPLTPSLSLD